MQKYVARVQLEAFLARFDHLQEYKPSFASLVETFKVNVVGDGSPIRQPFVTKLSGAEMKLTELQEDLAPRNFSQCSKK